jgi:hypothetical protein
MLADTREFGYFFNASVVLGCTLSFNTEDLLYLLMKTQLVRGHQHQAVQHVHAVQVQEQNHL